jgi:hypothetical protein
VVDKDYDVVEVVENLVVAMVITNLVVVGKHIFVLFVYTFLLQAGMR